MKRKILMKTVCVLACLLCSIGATADHVYAYLDTKDNTLRFCFDDNRDYIKSTGKTVFKVEADCEMPEWRKISSSVKYVQFEPSFAEFYPYSTSYWFCDMENLVQIKGLKYLKTGMTTDMSYMFANCTRLKKLDLRGLNTHNVKNMGYMFMNCTALENIVLSEFNTRYVTNMEGMFYRCICLRSLDLSSFNTANVQNITKMFSLCGSLISIYVGKDWSTKSVKAAKGKEVFNSCYLLKGGKGTSYSTLREDTWKYAQIDRVNSPGYLTANKKPYVAIDAARKKMKFCNDGNWPYVNRPYELDEKIRYYDPAWINDSAIGSITTVEFDAEFAQVCPTTTYRWFNGMKSLETIVGLSNLNTSEVVNMSKMFSQCISLKSLDLSDFNTEKVKNMSAMFSNCRQLENVDLSSFNTANVNNMYAMFNQCDNLKQLDLGSFNTIQVTNMEDMFYSCESLTTIYVSKDWNTAAVTNSNDMFLYSDKIVGGEGTKWQEEYIDKAYARIDGGVKRPGYFTAYREPYAEYKNGTLTFYYDSQRSICEGQTYTLPKREKSTGLNSGAVSPGWSRDGINSDVTKVVFDPSFANARPKSTYGWFEGMSKLTYIEGMEYLNTSEVIDMSWMFFNTKSLERVDLSSFNTAKVKYMSFMFNYSGLKSIDLSSFNTSSVRSMCSMFYGCRNLSRLDLSNFNTANVEDMSGMFCECEGLESIDLSSFNTVKVEDMAGMFEGCKSLYQLDLSNFNTMNVKAMTEMFKDCDNLNCIYAGRNWSTAAVTAPKVAVFKNCPKLTGGKGTRFIEGNNNASFARIDGGSSSPGYLTEK